MTKFFLFHLLIHKPDVLSSCENSMLRRFIDPLVLLLLLTCLGLPKGFAQENGLDSLFHLYVSAGKTAGQERQYDSAIHYLELATHIPLSDSLRMYTPFSNLGDMYYFIGNYPKALSYYQRALALSFQQQNWEATILEYYNVGIIHQYRGDYILSLDYLSKSLEQESIYHSPESAHASNCYNMIGLAHYYLDEYEQALDYFQTSLQIRLSYFGEHHALTAGSYNNIGMVHFEKDDFQTAISFYERAQKIRLNVLGRIHVKVAGGYQNLALCFKGMKQYTTALEYFHEAIDIFQADVGSNHPRLSRAYANIASVYQQQAQYIEQLSAAHKALDASTEQFSDPDPYQNPEVQHLAIHRTTINALVSKGNALSKLYDQHRRKSDIQASYEVFALGIQFLRRLENTLMTKSSLQMYRENGLYFFRGALDAALELFLLNGDKQWLHTAFDITESSKSYLLHQDLIDTEAKVFSDIPPHILKREQSFQSQIGELERDIFLLKSNPSFSTAELIQLQSQLLAPRDSLRLIGLYLQEQFPLYHQWKYQNSLPTLPDIQALIPDSSHLMVEYMFGLKKLYAFVIGKEKVVVHHLPIDSLWSRIKTVQQLVRNPRDFLPDGQYSKDLIRFQHVGLSLYRDLLQPLLQFYPKVRSLAILPDSYLGYLPFELLLKESSTVSRHRELDYLLHHYTFRYEFSASILQHSHQHLKQKAGAWIGFAPSRQAGDSLWSPLPYPELEIRQIQALSRGKAYLGNEALESQFKHQQARAGILHMASHAYTVDDEPAFSALVFSEESSDQEDGILYAYEIYQSRIAAEMVVLSACNTGFGPVAGGEGVMSLARAFKSAGCPNVVMSLWPVDDEMTARLMTRFYQYLHQQLPKDEALRQAKLDMILEAPQAHPHYWASFVLIGDHESVNLNDTSQQIRWLWASLGCLFLLLVVYRLFSHYR